MSPEWHTPYTATGASAEPPAPGQGSRCWRLRSSGPRGRGRAPGGYLSRERRPVLSVRPRCELRPRNHTRRDRSAVGVEPTFALTIGWDDPTTAGSVPCAPARAGLGRVQITRWLLIAVMRLVAFVCRSETNAGSTCPVASNAPFWIE